MEKQRENWIDNVKIFACVLVVCGHFFQSMSAAGLMEVSKLYTWFIHTIYSFHVPLFFICSGFLYQKHTCLDSVKAWGRDIKKKLIVLGIPYFAFSLITWLFKYCFSNEVNSQNRDLITSLFFHPISPYWYLYVLFFLFAITPTFRNRKMAMGCFLLTVTLKCLSCIGATPETIYLIAKIMECEIWFVLGMIMHAWNIPTKCCSQSAKRTGRIGIVAFILISVMISYSGIESEFISFVMGLLGCIATILLMLNYKTPYVRKLSKYTMPIFLMHTIFAAGLRVILLKIGVFSLGIHVVLGLSISFVGPIVATIIMERLKLDFLFLPGKYIKL